MRLSVSEKEKHSALLQRGVLCHNAKTAPTTGRIALMGV